MATMEAPQTYVSLNELYDLYVDSGTNPPDWLLQMLGKPVGPTITGEGLYRAALSSGIPHLFAVAEPDYERLESLQAGDGLYICGVQGAGKTWMACRVAKGWLSNNLGKVLFASSVQMLTEINDTYGSRGESEAQVIRRYTCCPLLVVDDLGKEVPSKWALSRLFTIFDTRYANRRPTIVTTQFGPDALAKRMSESGDTETALAIVSRFREKYRAVNMGSIDRRTAR